MTQEIAHIINHLVSFFFPTDEELDSFNRYMSLSEAEKKAIIQHDLKMLNEKVRSENIGLYRSLIKAVPEIETELKADLPLLNQLEINSLLYDKIIEYAEPGRNIPLSL